MPNLQGYVHPDALISALGERLQRERVNRRWKQSDVAAHTGLGVRTIQRLEAGQGGTIDTLVRVAQALDIDGLLNELSYLPPARPGRPTQRVDGPAAPSTRQTARPWGDEQ